MRTAATQGAIASTAVYTRPSIMNVSHKVSAEYRPDVTRTLDRVNSPGLHSSPAIPLCDRAEQLQLRIMATPPPLKFTGMRPALLLWSRQSSVVSLLLECANRGLAVQA